MTGKEIIQAERRRQIEKEGWAIEHDDSHINGELSKAADCYFYYAEDNDYNDNSLPDGWPWDAEYWKPKNQLADYTRAGALYLAELQRLERRGGDVGPTLTRLRISRKSCEITIDELHRQIGAAKFIIPSKETNQASTTLPGGETKQSLRDYILELNSLTTMEFCTKYKIEAPTYKGDVQLASFEFITLDAIKWDMVKEYAKTALNG